MGALYLYHESQLKTKDEVQETFLKRGFTESTEIIMGSYRLIVYGKMLVQNKQIYQKGQDCIVVCGTMIYKGLGVNESLSELFRDIVSNSIDENQLIGHFICVEFINSKIRIITDRLCTLPLYYSEDQLIFSSSFLALSSAIKTPLTINTFAMLEILLGQGVLPPDTQIDQIKRWTPSASDATINHISFYKYSDPQIDHSEIHSVSDAINRQIENLDAYFVQAKPLLTEYGACMGLTGGFDSRLLLAFLIRHGIKTECYTHWQNGVSEDFKIASAIAEKLSLKLSYVEEHYRKDSQGGSSLEDGYLFTDGQIRRQYYWNEIYTSEEYYKKLGLKARVGLNGVGGEQYRNSEGFPHFKGSLTNWLNDKILYTVPNVFLNKKLAEEFRERFTQKVANLLRIDETLMSNLIVKRYFNEVYGYTNRYYRAGFENQLMYHLSPFSDSFNSLYAYGAIPYLGNLHGFQMEMIKRVNPQLAGINSSYGFPFDANIPLLYKVARNIQRSLPQRQALKITSFIKGRSAQALPESYSGMIPELSEWIDYSKLPFTYETQTLLAEIEHFSKIIYGRPINE